MLVTLTGCLPNAVHTLKRVRAPGFLIDLLPGEVYGLGTKEPEADDLVLQR